MSDTNEPRRMPAKKPGQGQKPAGESKSDAPSMKERLLAERRAAEAAAAGKAAPSAKPAPAARPAAAPKAAGATKPAVKAAAGAARPTRATRAAAGDEGAAGARRGARAPREAKKKSPVPLIATGVLVVAAGVGGFIMMQKGDEPVEAGGGKTETVADGSAAGETDTNPEATDGATAPAEGASESAAETAGAMASKPAPAELNAAEAAALEGAKGLPSSKDPDSWNVIAITKNPDQINDPNSVDLTKLKPYGKPPGLDQAEWDTLVEDARLMFDANSGAKGTRAQSRLEKPGNINAWPAIMNEFIKLDPRRPDDNVVGMRAQRSLHLIRGGSAETFAFDWRTPSESGGELERKDLYANLQLIVELHDVWRRHLAAPDRYFREKIAKGDVQAQMMGVEPEKEAGSDEELNLDDIDLSDLGGG